MKKIKSIYIWLPLIIGASIAAGIFIGNIFSSRTGELMFWNQGRNKLESAFDYINKAYVDTVNTGNLIEKAIPAIMKELDPHSTYISASDMALRGKELDGHFSGIGVEFIHYNDTIAIVNVMNGGPSEAAGIMQGDRIVMVDDSLFVGNHLTNDQIFRRLRGDKGTKLNIKIKRKGQDKLLDFAITRADVPVESIDAAYMLADDVGYVKISLFGATTFNEFITAVAKLKEKGSKSLVIDLQQNSGGYMGAAILMTNEFMKGGKLILYTEGRTVPREDILADNTGTCKDDQVVVLIDEGSASASEIFAGAIQDHDRGLIVGRRSFGKGLVQSPHSFADGSVLRLTIARYHTPSGRCVQKAYEVGKGDEYGKDIYNRYMRGEFDSRDSIKQDSLPLFYTQAGRPVYGNDGILADVFVPRDTIGLNSYYLKVANAGYVRECAFDYADKYREKLKEYNNWQDLSNYLSNQPLVEYLVSFSESKGIRRRPYLIEEARSIMQTQLEALIVSNTLGREGFLPIFQRNDITIQKALNLIKQNKATPEAVRASNYN